MTGSTISTDSDSSSPKKSPWTIFALEVARNSCRYLEQTDKSSPDLRCELYWKNEWEMIFALQTVHWPSIFCDLRILYLLWTDLYCTFLPESQSSLCNLVPDCDLLSFYKLIVDWEALYCKKYPNSNVQDQHLDFQCWHALTKQETSERSWIWCHCSVNYVFSIGV